MIFAWSSPRVRNHQLPCGSRDTGLPSGLRVDYTDQDDQQIELLKLQSWIKKSGRRLVIVCHFP